MPEYIKRKSALHILDLVMSDPSIKHKGKAIRRRLKELPAEDVAEVKHGKWLEFEEGFLENIYQCSVCKKYFVFIEGTPEENLWKYCPNCVAKMDLKEGAEE